MSFCSSSAIGDGVFFDFLPILLPFFMLPVMVRLGDQAAAGGRISGIRMCALKVGHLIDAAAAAAPFLEQESGNVS